MDVHRVKHLGELVRGACRRDKAARVSRMADELRHAPAAEVFVAVRRLSHQAHASCHPPPWNSPHQPPPQHQAQAKHTRSPHV